MTTELIPIYILIFAFGIVIGSFLNVCIYRIPQHETVVTERVPLHEMRVSARVVRYGAGFQLAVFFVADAASAKNRYHLNTLLLRR